MAYSSPLLLILRWEITAVAVALFLIVIAEIIGVFSFNIVTDVILIVYVQTWKYYVSWKPFDLFGKMFDSDGYFNHLNFSV